MKGLLVFALSYFSLCAFAKEPIDRPPVIGVNSDYALPLVEVRRTDNIPRLESGILKDLGEALFNEIGLKPNWILLPKKRIAPGLISGQASIVCHLNEVWQPKIQDDVYWSHELYRSTNVVVFIKKKPLRSMKDLYGERVGVVLNFIYTSMDGDFAKGLIIREDGPNNESNVQKLLNGRIQFIVMSNLEFSYYKKLYPTLDYVDFGLDAVMTKCALSKKSSISINQLNRAVDTIKRNGTLDKILKSY